MCRGSSLRRGCGSRRTPRRPPPAPPPPPGTTSPCWRASPRSCGCVRARLHEPRIAVSSGVYSLPQTGNREGRAGGGVGGGVGEAERAERGVHRTGGPCSGSRGVADLLRLHDPTQRQGHSDSLHRAGACNSLPSWAACRAWPCGTGRTLPATFWAETQLRISRWGDIEVHKTGEERNRESQRILGHAGGKSQGQEGPCLAPQFRSDAPSLTKRAIWGVRTPSNETQPK